MKKKLKVVLGNLDFVIEFYKKCKELDVDIINTFNDIETATYEVLVESTKEQAYEILEFTDKYGGLLLKGE